MTPSQAHLLPFFSSSAIPSHLGNPGAVYVAVHSLGYLDSLWVSQVAQWVKNQPATVGDVGSIPGSGRSPGGGHGNSLQYSCLESPMDRGVWWATICGVTRSWTRLKRLSTAYRAHVGWGLMAPKTQTLPFSILVKGCGFKQPCCFSWWQIYLLS